MAKDSGAARPAGKKGDAEKAKASRAGAKASASRQWTPGRLRVRSKPSGGSGIGGGIAALKQLTGSFAAKPGLSSDRCPKPGKRHGSPQPQDDSTSSTKDSDDNGPTVCDECFPPGSRSRDNELKGWRWKCAMCSDYDLCTSCVMRTKHDPSHVFVSSIPPGGQDVPAHLCGMPSLSLAGPPGSAHENVSCRACDGQVVGLRFKCAVCDNYDLCECCFRAGQPEELHKLGSHNDQLHAWFLIRAPIKRPDAHSRFGSLWPYLPPRAAAPEPPAPRPVGRPKATASQQKPMTRNRSRQSVAPRDDGQESRRPRMKLRAAPEAAKPKAKAAAHRAALGAEVKSEPKSAAPKAARRPLMDPARSHTRASSQQEGDVRKRKLKGAGRPPGTAK
mmetsp:Transcript_27810/g.78735  ORF Transcript_27810/g.78735 Transcript_27810/m.78735 type:complete len:389 (-) Transcript_27810:210-1376(-)